MFDLENFRDYVGGSSGQSYSSGLKRVESDLGVNIDSEYTKDKCKGLINTVEEKKKDNRLSSLERKYWSDRCSHLRKYVEFKELMDNNNKERFSKWIAKQPQKTNPSAVYSPLSCAAFIRALEKGLISSANLDYKTANFFFIDDVLEVNYRREKYKVAIQRYDERNRNSDFKNAIEFYVKFLTENNSIFNDDTKTYNKEYTWIPFYEELADKLLEYKNKREELLELIKLCFEDLPFEYPFKEQGKVDYDDIDPFTIFGSFNKNMKDESRIAIATKYKEAFAVNAEVPADFTGIPVLMPLSAWFFAYKVNRGEKDIDNLWHLFETALSYADGDFSKEQEFINIYNQVITQRQVKWNITIGLYWVRPKSFLSLDSVSRAYLPDFNPPVGGIVSTHEIPDGKKYLWDIKELKKSFASPSTMAKSFYELSKKAFDFAEEDEYSENSKISDIIENYKLNFTKIDKEERYKWEAIKHYKDNWNIDAPDFAEMVERAFAKTFNLLSAGQYFARKMLVIFSQEHPEEVRKLFKILYDESLPLAERFDSFRAGFDGFIEGQKINHYQDLHAVSVYLAFEYPEKYCIYKYSVWTDFLKNIGEPVPSSKGKHETFKIESSNEICDKILDLVIEDRELCSMSQARLNHDCYDDPTFRLLAFDIMFFGSYYSEPEDGGSWWPSLEEYNPNLSKEDWKKYILEIELPDHPSPMQMLKAMMSLGGEASCKQLSQNFGGTPSYYVGCTMNLGRRVKKYFHLPSCMDGEQERYFPFPFLGRALDNEEGHQYIYKIRPELLEALNEIDLSNVSTYNDPENITSEIFADIKTPYTKTDFLEDVYISAEKYETCVSRLKHKKNLILQGAPGVGKTFAARRLAWSVMGVKDDNRIKFVQFHQSYSYEDFIMGYKPDGNGFSLKKGIFYDFCIKANEDPDNDYFFIIDEINRGNMSKIFGELLMLIENDYRGMEITLAYDKKPFSVPKNLYIIGMMNTADRSLAMIDYALRRRFSFVEMTPGFDSEGFETYQSTINNNTFGKLIGRIKALNADIENDASLGKGFRIGHSYFCNLKEDCSDAVLKEIVEYDIVPMLEEYWFDDEAKAKNWSNDLSGVFNG